MNWRMIGTLVWKDLKLYFANQFFAVVTVLGLVAYIAIYFLLPKNVEEELEMGLYMPNIPPVLADFLADEEINFLQYESDEALREAVLAGDIPAGYGFPDGSLAKIMAGEKAGVNLYLSSESLEEINELYAIVLDEFAYLLSGQELDIEFTEIFLGPDLAGAQIPLRQRMLPLLTIFILMLETMGLASLIASEVQMGTIQALLVTPLRIQGLFVAKGIFGTLFAFLQTVILLGITGGFRVKPGLILLALLLGSMLITGVGFLLGSVSKDLMSVSAWSILVILLLAIPSFAILIPGIASDWIKIIPSYYLVDTAYRVLNFDAGLSDVGPNLLILLACAIAFMALGVVVLRRKFR